MNIFLYLKNQFVSVMTKEKSFATRIVVALPRLTQFDATTIDLAARMVTIATPKSCLNEDSIDFFIFFSSSVLLLFIYLFIL